MEKPLCPICNTKHTNREPHVFKDVVKTEIAPTKNVSLVTNCPVCEARKLKAREKMKAWRARR